MSEIQSRIIIKYYEALTEDMYINVFLFNRA